MKYKYTAWVSCYTAPTWWQQVTSRTSDIGTDLRSISSSADITDNSNNSVNNSD